MTAQCGQHWSPTGPQQTELLLSSLPLLWVITAQWFSEALQAERRNVTAWVWICLSTCQEDWQTIVLLTVAESCCTSIKERHAFENSAIPFLLTDMQGDMTAHSVVSHNMKTSVSGRQGQGFKKKGWRRLNKNTETILKTMKRKVGPRAGPRLPSELP